MKLRPANIQLYGDYDRAFTYIGRAKKLVLLLAKRMERGKLDQAFWTNIKLDGGKATVNVAIIHTQPYISIASSFKPTISKEVWTEEVVEIPYRFFVRIGAPEDIVRDENGNTIDDFTRYYWIRFNMYPDGETTADQIGFARPGAKRELRRDYALKKIYYEMPRNVSNTTFHSVVYFPRYMNYNYTRSFDLDTETLDDQGLPVKHRFVAGYHFLATGNDIIYTPEISLPSGGLYDYANGTTMNPVNRFYIDLDTRTLMWYHVVQEWRSPTPTPPPFQEDTGSLSATIVGLDYNATLDTPAWEFTPETQINFNGSISEDYLFTPDDDYFWDVWSLNSFVPVGIGSDILSLTRSTARFNMTTKGYPFSIDWSFTLGSNASHSNLVEETFMYTQRVNDTGYETYQSVQTVFDSGLSDQDGDNLVRNDFTVTDCSSISNCDQDMVWTEALEFEETKHGWSQLDWSESAIKFSPDNFGPYGNVHIYNSTNDKESIWESVLCNGHACERYSCNTRNFQSSIAKTSYLLLKGTWADDPKAEIPAHNYTTVDYVTINIDNIFFARSIYFNGTSFAGSRWEGWDDDFAIFQAAGDYDPPLYEDGTSIDRLYTTSWPINYPTVDPIERASQNLIDYLPIEPPELQPGVSGSQIRYSSTYQVLSGTPYNTPVDQVKIAGIDDTFTLSGIIQSSIWDDRWSEGSEGIVVAVKSTEAGESAIYHDGVDKVQDIITALYREGILQEGELIFDIGLI